MRYKLGCVHTGCPSTSAPAQNGAVFRHWVPDISVPSSVPGEYKVDWGTGTVPEFWRGYLKKRCVQISTHQESISGTVLGHQVRTQPKSTEQTFCLNHRIFIIQLLFASSRHLFDSVWSFSKWRVFWAVHLTENVHKILPVKLIWEDTDLRGNNGQSGQPHIF